jgi:hypothetical protein
MTMEDIKAMNDDWLTPTTVANVLHMNTGRLIWYARNGQLPFPVAFSGTRVKISRVGFLKAYGYADPEEQNDTSQSIRKIEARLDQIAQLLKEALERRA